MNNTLDKPVARKSQVNILEALDLRLKHKHTYQEIANKYNVSKQAIEQALRKFISIIKTPEQLRAYDSKENDILKSIELELLINMVDSDKIKKATQGNLGYVYKNIRTERRLNEGKSTHNLSVMAMSDDLTKLIESVQVELDGRDNE